MQLLVLPPIRQRERGHRLVARCRARQDLRCAGDQFECLAIDLTKTTVTTNVQYSVQRKGADGIYYTIATSALQVAAGADSASIGQGVANVADAVAASSIWSAAAALGDVIRIVVTPTGAFTGTLSVKGK